MYDEWWTCLTDSPPLLYAEDARLNRTFLYSSSRSRWLAACPCNDSDSDTKDTCLTFICCGAPVCGNRTESFPSSTISGAWTIGLVDPDRRERVLCLSCCFVGDASSWTVTSLLVGENLPATGIGVVRSRHFWLLVGVVGVTRAGWGSFIFTLVSMDVGLVLIEGVGVGE